MDEVLAVAIDRAQDVGSASIEGLSVSPIGGSRALLIEGAPGIEMPPQISGWRIEEQRIGRWLALPGEPWSIEIGRYDLARDGEYQARLIVDAEERRCYVRHAVSSSDGVPFDEWHGRVRSFSLPTGYACDSVAALLALCDLERFAEAWQGTERDERSNLVGVWDRELLETASDELHRAIESIPARCRVALTCQQVLAECLLYSSREEVADRLREEPGYLGHHEEADVVDADQAAEIGEEWLERFDAEQEEE